MDSAGTAAKKGKLAHLVTESKDNHAEDIAKNHDETLEAMDFEI